MDELEAKAREFEVLSSVNLNKILGLLENKEERIMQLAKNEQNMSEAMQAVRRANEKDIAAVKKKAVEETKYKVEAMTKLESLRQELQAMQGGEAPAQSVSFWKEQCQSLFDICRNLKDDNEKLVSHFGALQTSQGGEPDYHHTEQAHAEMLHYLNQHTAYKQTVNKHARNRS